MDNHEFFFQFWQFSLNSIPLLQYFLIFFIYTSTGLPNVLFAFQKRSLYFAIQAELLVVPFVAMAKQVPITIMATCDYKTCGWSVVVVPFNSLRCTI